MPVKTAGRADAPESDVRHHLAAVRHTEHPFVTFRLAGSDVPLEHAGMLAEGMFAISLAVRIYDAADVPGHHLARARSTVEGILMNGAGVATTWTHCPCPSPVRANELVIRIAPASPASPPASLGFSFVDVGRRMGTLATVFADRVRTMAALTGVDEGELMGRVIAHEIAHLLIGTRDHSRRGLMRGEWRESEIALQRPADWVLSRSEGLTIRRSISRRASEPPVLMAVDDEAGKTDTPQ